MDRLKRDADLLDYACNRAGYEIDWKESSPRGNPTHWILRRQSDDSKILVLRGRTCWLYFDLREHGQELGSARLSPGRHGTIIDFVQDELGLMRGHGLPSLGIALKQIRDFVGVLRRDPPPTSRERAIEPAEEPRVPGPEVLQRWNTARAAATSSYLASRALTSATLSDQRFAATWRLADRDTVLFPHRDGDGRLVGFEMKNHGFTSYAAGGVKTGIWRSNDLRGDRRLLVTESAINALSFHQLHPELAATHRSFGGRIGTAQIRLLQAELERLPSNCTVLLAFDGAGDLAGRRYEEQVRAVLPRGLRAEIAHPPHGKDWNDYLQMVERDR